MMRNWKKVVKYGFYGSVLLGGAVTAYSYPNHGSFAVVRFARTAFTAVDVGWTYNRMLYTKEWDTDSPEYIELRSQAHQIGANKILDLCIANKGVYIKVGQHIGALDYLLPNEYVTTLRILHKDAPKNSVEELYVVMKEELKQDPNEVFTDFEKEPLGTASLAQVHRAKLKDGSDVAVKVQHHFVRHNTDTDLKWMEFIINIMSIVFPDFQMQWLVDETKKNIKKELDFLQEGRNAEKFAEMFKDYKWLKVPKIYWDHSTERLLIMEYVNGGQVNDIKYIDEHNIDRVDLCKKISGLYSQMIFINGFVHCDPHPGNILLKKEPGDKDTTVYLLDHGLYATLTDEFRFNYSKLWLSIISYNLNDMRYYSEKLGVKKDLFFLLACIVTGRPWESIEAGIAKVKPSTKEKTVFQKELPNFLHHITHCLEHVDRQALLVFKTNDLIRSIEYALGTQDKMYGFMVMSKCCIESVYNQEYKNTTSTLKRSYLQIKYRWSMFLLYVYSIYLNLLDRVRTPLLLS